MNKPSLTLFALFALAACSSATSNTTIGPDANTLDAGANKEDAGARDAGPTTDPALDASTAPNDGGTADATTPVDAGPDATADSGTAQDAAADAAADAGVDATVMDAGPAPAGATCGNATLSTLPLSGTYTMDATYGDDFTSGAGCLFKAGPDRVFAVDVAAGKRLYASVRGTGTYDPSVAIVEGTSACADRATTCVSASDVGLATSLNFVAVTNDTPAAKRYFVVVDGNGNGDYEFRAIQTDALPGDTCAGAPLVALDANGAATLTNQTVDLYTNDYATGSGCSGFAGGERVYRMAVPANGAVAITVTPEAGFDAALNVIDGAPGANPEAACAAAITCTAAANVGGAGAAERVLYRNTTGAPKTIFFTVETAVSTTTPGSFSIGIETLPATPGDTCATTPSVAMANGTETFTNQSLRYAFNDYAAGTSCVGTTGPERGYAVDIPAGKILTVVATPTGTATDAGASALDVALNLQTQAACTDASRSCIAGVNTTGAGAAERLVYSNVSTSTVNAVLFVEAATTAVSAPGTYDVTFTLSDPPAGDSCGSAPTTFASGTYPGQTLIGYQNDYGLGTNCVSSGGPDRLYLVRVPAGERLTAKVTPDPLDGGTNWNPSINLMERAPGCVATGRLCIVGKDSGATGVAESLVWTNNTAVEKEVYVVVETSSTVVPAAGVTRGFTLELAIAPPPPPPPGESCANAEPITSGTPLTDQTILGYANDYGLGSFCYGTSGPDRVYTITVPAGERLVATVTPTTVDGGTWDPSINIMNAAQCQSATRTCLAGADSGSTSVAETTAWTNTTSSPVQVYIAIETRTSADPAPGATRSFTLSATVAPPPPPPAGDVCRDTLPLISTTTTLTGESLAGCSSDYEPSIGSSCEFGDGVDRAYRVRIPAGGTLTAIVTPTRNWDPTLSLILGGAAVCLPQATSCVASADTGADGAAETISYTNSTSSAVDGFIIVDDYLGGTVLTDFNLAITIN